MWAFNRKAILCLPLNKSPILEMKNKGKCWEHTVFLSVPTAGDVCTPRDLILPSAMNLTIPLEDPEGKKSFRFQWWKQSCGNRFKSQRLLGSHIVLTSFQWERRHPGRRRRDFTQAKTCLRLPSILCPQVGTEWLEAEIKAWGNLWDAAWGVSVLRVCLLTASLVNKGVGYVCQGTLGHSPLVMGVWH